MRLIFMAIGSIAIVAGSFFITLHFIDTYRLMKLSPDQLRKADVDALQRALEAYKKAHHTYQVAGAGSGGMGWVNYSYDGAPSLVKALHDGGYLPSANLNDSSQLGNYLIYLCDGGHRYSISATLDHPSAAEISHALTTCNGTGPNGTFTVYKKNYSVGN